MSLIPLGFWAASSAVAGAGSFDLLETEILASSAASVTFSGLSAYAADYQHLQIRIAARTDRAGQPADLLSMQFNGDTTGTNYYSHELNGNGSSVVSSANADILYCGYLAGATAPTSAFAGVVIDILDPFETTKYKTTRSLSGYATNRIALVSGMWESTSAVSSILLDNLGTNFITGSRFSLYGLKASA